MERRDFLTTMCYGGFATFGTPLVRFAQVPGPGRLVFVQLRGGFDGLAAVVPVGDPGYSALRGDMAFEPGDLTPLGEGFGLAPGLGSLEELWDANEMVALHAMAIPYRTRSHFDGQAILETGLASPDGAADGWLNRLLQVMEGKRSAIAVAAGMPRSLTGPFPVSTWSPATLGAVDDGYLDRLHFLYRSDRVLMNRFEAALQQRDAIGDMGGDTARGGPGARSRGPSTSLQLKPTGFFLTLRACAACATSWRESLPLSDAAAQHRDAACPAGRSAFAGENDEPVFADADSLALSFPQRAQVDRAVFQQDKLRSVPAIEQQGFVGPDSDHGPVRSGGSAGDLTRKDPRSLAQALNLFQHDQGVCLQPSRVPVHGDGLLLTLGDQE